MANIETEPPKARRSSPDTPTKPPGPPFAGKVDLLARVIRTPLPPRTTFLDDPLRVLRAVRFGARFDFALDPELVEAASSAEVRAALGTKVSRERMGVEVRPAFCAQKLQ